MSARILRVTPEQYRADPCAVPSLSSSIAHELVERSPLHAWTIHPRLGGERSPSTKARDDGSVMHRLILGKGTTIAVIDAPDFRTNRARDLRDQAIAEGKLPVLQDAYAEKLAIAEKLRERCIELGFALDGESEVAFEFVDGDSVVCRCLMDHVWIEQGRIIDLKKVRSAKPRDIERLFVEYGYDIQYAAYTRALGKFRPEFEGQVSMTFLFAEIEPPYSVVPVELDDDFREIGFMRWERAVNAWRQCLADGRWPGYTNGPVMISPPRWVRLEHLGDDLDMSGVGLEAA